MTKKQFVAVTAYFARAMDSFENDPASNGFDRGYQSHVVECSKALAGIFAETDSRFDRARFLKACKTDGK